MKMLRTVVGLRRNDDSVLGAFPTTTVIPAQAGIQRLFVPEPHSLRAHRFSQYAFALGRIGNMG